MLTLVSRRCERASLTLTSNKVGMLLDLDEPFIAWGDILGDEVTAAATIDRLLHHAEILAPKGDSDRLNHRDFARPTPLTL